MFRWNLMLKTLFGSRREQPKARRPKAMLRLRLEVLEDRTLPAVSPENPLGVVAVASPPVTPVAALTSYVESTINQWTQFVAMVQQEFLGYYQGLIQEFAQAVFSAEQMIAQVDSTVVQEVDHFFGINPNTSNPSFNTVASQPGNGVGRGNNSGSGSGAGAPTTHAAPTQPINHSPQQSGNGSGTGSSSTTTTHGNASGHTLHPMTGSGGSGSLGSGSNGSGSGSVGSGTGSGDADVYGNVWLDNDADGSKDNGEMGYSGATVQLVNATTHQVVQSTTTTGTNGSYVFDNPPLLLGPQPVSFFVHVVLINQLGATYFAKNGSQINTKGNSAPFLLASGGWREILAGLLSMNVNTKADDPNGPALAGLQDQVTLRDAIKVGNTGGGPLHLTAVTFINYQKVPAQPLSGIISLQAALDPIKKSYDIDGPGSSTLTVNGNNSAGTIFTVNAGVTSTISGLTITGGSGANGGGVNNNGNLTLSDIVLNNNQTTGNGGGIYNESDAQLKLQTVTIGSIGNQNSATKGGGGIYNSGTVTICCGSTIIGNKAGGGGGGIYNSEGTIQVFDDTEINNNSDSGLRGGGVYNWNGKFQMYGGSIADNKETKSDGGGAYNYFGTMTLTGASVVGNRAIGYGGGIYTYEGSLTLTSHVFIGSSAQADTNFAKRGGGLYENNSVVKMTGGGFTNNTATTPTTGGGAGASSGGGGLYVNAGSLTLTNVSISHNGSMTNGGGVYVRSGSLKLINAVVTYNGGGDFGGGMFIKGGTVTVSGGTFQFNQTRKGAGGGFYNYTGTLTLNSYAIGGNIFPVVISDNFAFSNGGGMYLANNSKTTFNNASVSGNFTSLNIQTTGRGVFEQSLATVTINLLNDNDDDGGVPYRSTGSIG